jgi:hypothetical protein
MVQRRKSTRRSDSLDIEKTTFLVEDLCELIRKNATDVVASPHFAREHLYLTQRAQALDQVARLANWTAPELERLLNSLERRARELVAHIEAKDQA